MHWDAHSIGQTKFGFFEDKSEEMKRDIKMTTKIKLTVAEVVLVVVMAMSMLTAVQLHTGTVTAGFHAQEVAGDICSTECGVG